METIWSYLKSIGYDVVERDSKHVVHLALESDKMNKAQLKRMPVRYDTTEKLDGVYSLVTVVPIVGGILEVRHWGRSGKPQSNCELLDALLSHNLQWTVKTPTVLISEVTSDNPLAELSGFLTPSRVNPITIEQVNLKDNFHDIISVKEFIKGESDMVFHYRMISLLSILYDTNIKPVESLGYMSLDDARALAESTVFPRGGEGLVLVDIHSNWVAGARNESMIKVKEKLSFDVTVIGYCSGKEGSKYEETLGKLLVAFPLFGDSDNKFVIVPISGMTDANRDLWYAHSQLIVGATVKMDAKSYTATGNLREPRFKEVRTDKESQFPVSIAWRSTQSVKAKSKWTVFDWSE